MDIPWINNYFIFDKNSFKRSVFGWLNISSDVPDSTITPLSINKTSVAISLANSIIVKNKISKIIWLSVSILWTITFLINLAIMMGLL